MVNSIWKIVRNPEDTEDVLQNVLLRIMKKSSAIRKHPNPTALILRMCINSALDWRRKSMGGNGLANPSRLVENLRSSILSPSEQVLLRERQDQVMNAIRALPSRQGEALILRVIEGLTYPEVAQAMKCRESTARVLVAKARKRIKIVVSTHMAPGIIRTTETEA